MCHCNLFKHSQQFLQSKINEMESTSKENSEVQYVRIHGDTGGLQYIYSL